MNINELIDRVKKSCGYSSDADIARALGMSPQNFLSRKKSGGIKDPLISLAVNKGINEAWLITGQGEMRQGEKTAERDPLSEKIISDLLSDKQYLKERITSLEKKCADFEDEVSGLKKQIDMLTAPPIGADLKVG